MGILPWDLRAGFSFSFVEPVRTPRLTVRCEYTDTDSPPSEVSFCLSPRYGIHTARDAHEWFLLMMRSHDEFVVETDRAGELPMSRYLQSGLSKTDRGLTPSFLQRLREQERLVDRTFDAMESQLAQTQGRLEELEARGLGSGLSTEDLELLQSTVERRVVDDLVAEIGQRVEAKYADEIRHEVGQAKVERQFADARDRLQNELTALTKRANLNLIIGSFATLGALAVLTYILVLQAPGGTEWSVLASHYVPRLSLIIVIEIFAFFFLRLYKTTLSEIKYFQNELTNVELKYAALEAASGSESLTALEGVLSVLAQTERNFVLQAGETTVELAKGRMDVQHQTELIRAVQEALTGKSGTSGSGTPAG